MYLAQKIHQDPFSHEKVTIRKSFSLTQGCPNPVLQPACGPRVDLRKTSRATCKKPKQYSFTFFCFVRSPPKITAKIESKYGGDLFLQSSLKFPLVFTSNLTRNRFRLWAGVNCAARPNSPWPVPPKLSVPWFSRTSTRLDLFLPNQ